MAIHDIRPDGALGAIKLLDDPIEGPQLLPDLDFGAAQNFRLVHEGRFYPAKAVLGVAHGVPHDCDYLTSHDLTGGVSKRFTAVILSHRELRPSKP